MSSLAVSQRKHINTPPSGVLKRQKGHFVYFNNVLAGWDSHLTARAFGSLAPPRVTRQTTGRNDYALGWLTWRMDVRPREHTSEGQISLLSYHLLRFKMTVNFPPLLQNGCLMINRGSELRSGSHAGSIRSHRRALWCRSPLPPRCC